MINLVNSSIGLSQMGSNSHRQIMTEGQKGAVEDILSKYDANSISQSDAKEISNSFKELEIRPSRELRETIESAGFDADNLRELSSKNQVHGMRPPPPPPPPPQKSDDEEMSELEEILAEILQGDDEDTTSLTATEQIVEYTNKIMHLTDDLKNEVNDLFEMYKPENTSYSKENVGKIISSSLGDILGDSSNYNHIDFYG